MTGSDVQGSASASPTPPRHSIHWISILLALPASAQASPEFVSRIQPLSEADRARMEGTTWKPACPVPLSDLVKLRVRHWTFDGTPADGVLIVHRSAAPDLRDAFEKAYDDHFPVHSIKPASEFGGDDARSMKANNTSAFNCRRKTPPAQGFSRHSWGTAIDVNPVENPWVRGERVLPERGRAHVDRSQRRPGELRAESALVQVLTARGWRWGGRWRRLQDYQHLERPEGSVQTR